MCGYGVKLTCQGDGVSVSDLVDALFTAFDNDVPYSFSDHPVYTLPCSQLSHTCTQAGHNLPPIGMLPGSHSVHRCVIELLSTTSPPPSPATLPHPVHSSPAPIHTAPPRYVTQSHPVFSQVCNRALRQRHFVLLLRLPRSHLTLSIALPHMCTSIPHTSTHCSHTPGMLPCQRVLLFLRLPRSHLTLFTVLPHYTHRSHTTSDM